MTKYDVSIFATNSIIDKDIVSKVTIEINPSKNMMIVFAITLGILVIVFVFVIGFYISYLKQKNKNEYDYKIKQLYKNDEFRKGYIKCFIDEFKTYKKYHDK